LTKNRKNINKFYRGENIMNPIDLITDTHNMSRAELSRKTKIPYITLTSLANGWTAKPQRKTLRRLSLFSKISPKELMDTYQAWRNAQAQE